MTLSLSAAATLNNGVRMPWLGLGVWQAASGRETREAVLTALELGYRHIDTASAYGNEADVGQAVRDSGLPRDEVFVTTKLWNQDHGYEAALRAWDGSHKRLGLGQVDLYLIHWPMQQLRHDSWRALSKLLAEGYCRAIGVSNYTIRHLRECLERSEVVPAVNQVEFHPFLFQKELLDFCKGAGIQLEAYSPLAQGQKLGDPTLREVASRYGRSPAQVMIRWALQHEVVVIPKSVHPGRIRENAEVCDFALSEADMARLDALDEGFRTCWDPTEVP